MHWYGGIDHGSTHITPTYTCTHTTRVNTSAHSSPTPTQKKGDQRICTLPAASSVEMNRSQPKDPSRPRSQAQAYRSATDGMPGTAQPQDFYEKRGRGSVGSSAGTVHEDERERHHQQHRFEGPAVTPDSPSGRRSARMDRSPYAPYGSGGYGSGPRDGKFALALNLYFSGLRFGGGIYMSS